MTTNVERFELEISRFEREEIPRRHSELVQKIALEALEGVVSRTPVDTGFARNNWDTTLHNPPAETTDSASPIAQGEAVIRSAPPFTDIWISNGARYIRRLEDGHSGQAPEGMVAVTVAQLRSRYGE